jgi:ribosomal protein S27AE
MTPDLNTAIANHRATLTTWWKTPRYRIAVENLKIAKPFCQRCGRPTTTALHKAEDYPKGYEHYVKVVEDLTVAAGCQQCNREELRNHRPCPQCVEAYRADPLRRIRYIPFDVHCCFSHLPQAEQDRLTHLTKVRRVARSAAARFPCSWRRVQQQCMNPSRFSGICDRSPVTAEGCDYYLSRKVSV